jgi:hypothetical protein
MLLCLLVVLVGLDAVRRSWRSWWVVPLALSAALLVKGVFVAIPLVAAAIWIAINPLRTTGPAWRAVVVCLVGLAMMALVVVIYDALYRHVTGENFWGPYWGRQLAPLTLSAPGEAGSTFGTHLRFYLVRLLWHPAPWSLALMAGAWRWRGRLGRWWAAAPPAASRGLAFVLVFAAASVLLLSSASRFAERYTFSANYLVAAAGVVVAARIWPRLSAWLGDLDARIPGLPAFCWLTLMLLRLALGPFLPRISG